VCMCETLSAGKPRHGWNDDIEQVFNIKNASILSGFTSVCIDPLAVLFKEVMNFRIP
jgi:hypothetical protein